jgi:hypothetical protein
VLRPDPDALVSRTLLCSSVGFAVLLRLFMSPFLGVDGHPSPYLLQANIKVVDPGNAYLPDNAMPLVDLVPIDRDTLLEDQFA